MLRVTPLYGSRWSNDGPAQEPTCTLVEFGACRILWNMGLPLNGRLPPLPPHDCLLLTDSTLGSMGGLPLYYAQQQQQQQSSSSSPPTLIYATFPIVKMGQMTLYDYHANLCTDGQTPPFTLAQMDDAIAACQAVKYSQQLLMHDISITAHRAGHSVGASFFVLQRTHDETTVVLTKTYHMAHELHLESSTLLQYATTPDVLVTYPGGPALKPFQKLATTVPPHSKKPPLAPQLITQTHRQLTEHIMSVLRRNGNILLPTDAASRALELVVLLNQYWERHRLQNTYNLVWLGPMVHNTLAFAKSQTEWMNERMLSMNTGAGNTGGRNAKQRSNNTSDPAGQFNLFKTIQCCSTVAQVEALMQQNPTCILATGADLEHGPARTLLVQLADNPDNAVLFTDSSYAYLRTSSATSTTAKKNATTTNNPSEDGDTPMTEAAAAGEGGVSSNDPAFVTDTTANNSSSAATPATQATSTDSATNTQDPTAAATVAQETAGEEEEEGDAAMLVTTQASKWNTAAQLLRAWGQAKAKGLEDMEDAIDIDVAIPKRFPLAGQALQDFVASEKHAAMIQQQQAERQAMLREVELAKGQLRLGEDEGGSATSIATKGPSSTTNSSSSQAATKVYNKRPRKKSRFDQSLFLKFSKPLHLSYEVREEAVGIGQEDSIAKFGIGESIGRSGEVMEDDYGIAVKTDFFKDIVSGVDPSKFGASGRVGEDVLRRGFGYAGSNANASGSGAARVSEDEGGADADDMNNEQELEALDLSEGTGIIRGRNGRQPMKVTTVQRKLEVLAEISYIPMEGRVDARVARQSVRALQPRQVIVMGGPARENDEPIPDSLVDEVTNLAKAAESFKTGSAPVLTPSDGETAELNVGHSAYSVRLIDTPYQTPEEREAGAEPPEPVEPYEVKLGACTVSLVDCVATGQKSRLDGSLALAPTVNALQKKSTPVYLSAGDVLLTDLRAELIAKGFKADYSTHKQGYSQLLVNGRITVRKNQSGGRMQVEGPLCEDFFAVRTMVCQQYVVL